MAELAYLTSLWICVLLLARAVILYLVRLLVVKRIVQAVLVALKPGVGNLFRPKSYFSRISTK